MTRSPSLDHNTKSDFLNKKKKKCKTRILESIF